jgi:hypothetical protein
MGRRAFSLPRAIRNSKIVEMRTRGTGFSLRDILAGHGNKNQQAEQAAEKVDSE